MNLPLQGGDFTWSRSGINWVCSRFDSFLISMDREEHFNDTLEKRLPRPLLDCLAICLENENVGRGKILFKFETIWLAVVVEGFLDLIKN